MLASAPTYPVLAATDLDRARGWYSEKLGLEPAMDMEGALIYRSGATMFMLYETPYAGTAKNTVAGWLVDDLDAVMSDLRSRGVRFEDYDLEGGPKTVDGVATDPVGGRTAWFSDSEGNILSVTQAPPGMSLP